MIDAIIGFAIRRRWAVIVTGFLLGVAGLLAARDTPMDAIPDVSEEQVIVFADWPGHSPREVEEQVAYPLSLELQGIRGVRVVRASSDFNFAMLNVILAEGTSTLEGRRRVAERLVNSASNLPSGVVPRLGPDAAPTGQIYWYTVEGKGLDLGQLRAIQDWTIKPQLSSVPGVAEVASVGGFPIEYEVAVDPVKLRRHGVTLAELVHAIANSNSSVGGHAIQKAKAEYLVRGVGWLGSSTHGESTSAQICSDLEHVPLRGGDGNAVLVSDLARVALAPGPRRGVLEKDGNEAVGGVILMASGENPLEVTRRIRAEIHALATALPAGVVIRPFYDRTPLIVGAIGTVTSTVLEAIITATLCILLVLMHLRTSFIIAITLPLAALGSFLLMWILRALNIVDIQTNIMSLSGIAISIGVLVDSSIVMAENVMHRLKEHFGDRPATGDLRGIILPACRAVGRPIVFSVFIMILSFLPVFALGGMEGKMFRPLAFTKTFALVSVAALSITLVPALCTIFIRGRLRREDESAVVRGMIEIYRPVLNSLLDRPSPLIWFLGVTFVVGLAPIGDRRILLIAVFLSLVACGWTFRSNATRFVSMTSLIAIALIAEHSMTPLGRDFITPLDEGMIMDMPITVPRASITQSADDLKARDMVLCRFPEVDMVVGKAGRADTPTDPAPMDMIETMVNLRPRSLWPRRRITEADAARVVEVTRRSMESSGLLQLERSEAARSKQLGDCLASVLPVFNAQMREYAYQRNAEFQRERPAQLTSSIHGGLDSVESSLWTEHVRQVDAELIERGARLLARLCIEDWIARCGAHDRDVSSAIDRIRTLRSNPAPRSRRMTAGHHGPSLAEQQALPVIPQVESLQEDLGRSFARGLVLWRSERSQLLGAGGEIDRAVNMPGWSNIWTMPIQNRVDMLATGVNTSIGIRVLGRSLDEVVAASESIAQAMKKVPGATDVVADPIRGKGYLEIHVDRSRAAKLGVSVGDANDVIEIAIGGRVATMAVLGRQRQAVRVRYARDFRADEENARDLLVPSVARDASGQPTFVRLGDVADVRIVEGPATIKSENGMLRNYVRLNVRGRSASDVVADGSRMVAGILGHHSGVHVEWTGQFEHEARARGRLTILIPVVVVLIFGILYWTYHDLADALLMLMAVPGAIAGGITFQWLFGFPFTVTVWVGYVACFGMATSTGIIMLVYLREAVARVGGLGAISLDQLRSAVLDGAVHRLRPKLLTEGTVILGLVPMLWADGPGSEVIRPMVAPVLGGILAADEVIDLFLPVLFYHVRKWRWARIHTSRAIRG
ncbi:MAG: cusA 2 [Planctomycetota bacterium]|nr:cusA 2 [Planctomycetota bacterium]